MGDDISRTSAPVRQLVEHFDHLLENSSSEQMKSIEKCNIFCGWVFRWESTNFREVFPGNIFFLLIIVEEKLSSSNQLMKGQPNVTDAAELHSPLLHTC
ncbi:hypothetical protein WUBG_04578 [Wuchereria bancrofti]|uniref:Uncharacterized protein n=1 Tax=Wuchereria bancrofti TaxID=6293 RepID=J9FAW7_WUCBA|nr:hypothetical protein WUBG_04578 [Wuchereria bancrofti]